jgi:hypothetical protein
MEFTFLLRGGPLDGNALHGLVGSLPRDRLDLGVKAYHDSNNAELGHTFETFTPFASIPLRAPTPLHIYRAIAKRLVRCKSAGEKEFHEKINIEADYIGPSPNHLFPLLPPES